MTTTPTPHPLLARLGLRHPIFQAPMAGVSTPALAAAVTQAGALGALGLGASTVDQAREALIATRAFTRGPINANVFCHAPARRDAAREAAWLDWLAPLFAQADEAPPQTLNEIYPSFVQDDATLDLLLEQRPAVVSFHFGLPPPERIRALQQAGIVTLATATRVAEAQQIEAAGVDGIVAQGIEAGGHRGLFDPQADDEALDTLTLLRQIVAATRLPVIAAGGLMTGQDIRAALAAGAAAAQLGTAFILCPESAASPAYRDQLSRSRASDSRLTRVLSGRPARGLVNRYIQHGEAPGAPEPADYPVAYDAAKQLLAAAVRQRRPELAASVAAHWAGLGAPLARALPAQQLIQTLVKEMD